jgi:hypothetical protein
MQESRKRGRGSGSRRHRMNHTMAHNLTEDYSGRMTPEATFSIFER